MNLRNMVPNLMILGHHLLYLFYSMNNAGVIHVENLAYFAFVISSMLL